MSVFFTASYPPRHYHYHPFDSSVDYYHQLAAERERRAQAARALARRQRQRELEDFYQFQSMLSHHHRHNHHQRRWAPYRYTVHRILPREPSPEQVRRDEQEQKIDAWLERRRRKEAVERIFGSLFLGNNNEAIESTQEGDTQPAPESNASGNDTEFVEKLWNALGSGRSDEEKERILRELNLPRPQHQHQPGSTPTTTTPDVKGKAKEVSVADPEEAVHIPVIEVGEPASAPVASTSASGTEETHLVDKEASPAERPRSRSASVSSSSSIVEPGGEKKVRRPSSVVVEEVVDEDN